MTISSASSSPLYPVSTKPAQAPPKPAAVPAPTDADGDHDGDTAASERGGIDVYG
ncbi:MAG: hypothetical protein ACTHM6_14095 [Tepidisphaeraceae bacterium]